MVKVFVSHSAQDEETIEKLVQLLQASFRLSASEIRCSSLDGYRCPPGDSCSRTLLDEIRRAPVFLGVISGASLESMYVALEVGARWGLGKDIIPLLTPGTPVRALDGPLRGLQAIDMKSSEQLFGMLSTISSRLETDSEPPDAVMRYVDAIASSGTGGGQTADGSRGAQVTNRAGPQVGRHFFIVGCRAGDKISLFPGPPDFDDAALTDFLDSLTAIARSAEARRQARKIRNVKDLRNVSKERCKSMILDYFDAINSLPATLQADSTSDEFGWFKLGYLLYSVQTHIFMQSRNSDENPPGDEDGVEHLLIALAALLEQLELPLALKKEVSRFVQSTRDGMSVDALARDVNVASNAILSWMY